MYSFLGKIKGVFWIFFPPDSRLELFFRSLYHKISATGIYTNFVIRKSEGSYPGFLKVQDEWLQHQAVVPGESLEVTFFLPIPHSQSEAAMKTIQSICAQRAAQWHLVILTESENINSFNKLLSQEDQERIEVTYSPHIQPGGFYRMLPD